MRYDLVGFPDRLISYRLAGSEDVHILEVWGDPDPTVLPVFIAQEAGVPDSDVQMLTAA